MNELEKLKIEMEILLSLNFVQAYIGSLDNLRQGSYVKSDEIIKLINERREKLK